MAAHPVTEFQRFVQADVLGNPIGGSASGATSTPVTLLNAATATGSYSDPLAGGLYAWDAVSSNFNGATLTLQFRGPDGSTAIDTNAALTANGSVPVEVSAGSRLRVAISGATPAAVTSTLSRIS